MWDIIARFVISGTVTPPPGDPNFVTGSPAWLKFLSRLRLGVPLVAIVLFSIGRWILSPVLGDLEGITAACAVMSVTAFFVYVLAVMFFLLRL